MKGTAPLLKEYRNNRCMILDIKLQEYWNNRLIKYRNVFFQEYEVTIIVWSIHIYDFFRWYYTVTIDSWCIDIWNFKEYQLTIDV